MKVGFDFGVAGYRILRSFRLRPSSMFGFRGRVEQGLGFGELPLGVRLGCMKFGFGLTYSFSQLAYTLF